MSSPRERRITQLENKVKHWSDYLMNRREYVGGVFATKMVEARTDAQRDHWSKWHEAELAKVDAQEREHLTPAEVELRELMFAEAEDQPKT